VLEKAYEFARAGDFLGAARDCELQYRLVPSMVSAVEGVDFYVLARAPEEALRFAQSVDDRSSLFAARLEFFRALAHWDLGREGEARGCLARALELGYDNDARLVMEWSKRLSKDDLDSLMVTVGRKKQRGGGALTLLEEILPSNILTPFTGSEAFASLLPFLQGVAHGFKAAGVFDSRYQGFLTWMLENGMFPRQGGWTTYFLEKSGGDDQKARALFLLAVKRFIAQESERAK